MKQAQLQVHVQQDPKEMLVLEDRNGIDRPNPELFLQLSTGNSSSILHIEAEPEQDGAVGRVEEEDLVEHLALVLEPEADPEVVRELSSELQRRLDGDVAHLGRQHAGEVFHRVGHFAKHLAGSSSSGLYHRARAAPIKAA
jgi:hypothetical protein